MSECKFCHGHVKENHETLVGNHEVCTMDYIKRSKLGLCVKCNIPIESQRYHICRGCLESDADFTGYTIVE